MVPEKGMFEAAEALSMVLPHHPDWSARLIGARGFQDGDKTPYEHAVAKALEPCGRKPQALGFLPIDDVYKEQEPSGHRAGAIPMARTCWPCSAGGHGGGGGADHNTARRHP